MKWINYIDRPFPRDMEVAVKWGTQYGRSFDLDDPQSFGMGEQDYLIHAGHATHIAKADIYWLDEEAFNMADHDPTTMRYVVLTEQYDDLEEKYNELLEKNKVPEGYMRVDVPVGSLIIPPDLLKDTPSSLINKVIKKEYPVQDDTWSSRRWNKDMTDYCDMGGEEIIYDEDKVKVLLAEQHRNTRHDAVEALLSYMDKAAITRLPSEQLTRLHNTILNLPQRSPLQ